MTALADVAREALYLTVLLVGPPVGAALAAGLAVALIQAATQIQEQTIGFAARAAAALAALAVSGPWVAEQLRAFAASVLTLIGEVGG